MLPYGKAVASTVATVHRALHGLSAWSSSGLLTRWITTTAITAKQPGQVTSLSVDPGALVHVTCSHPLTAVSALNTPGVEDAVTLQVQEPHLPAMPGVQPYAAKQGSVTHRVHMELLPGGRIIDIVEQCPGLSTTTAAMPANAVDQQQQQQQQQPALAAPLRLHITIPTRGCGLSVTTAGGSVTVGQLQEADMQLSTAGGAVDVGRCRANNASINTSNTAAWGDAPGRVDKGNVERLGAAAAAFVKPGGIIKVGELSASRVTVSSGGAPVSLKRLFGLTVDVTSGGGPISIASLYADRAAVSSAQLQAPDANSSSTSGPGGGSRSSSSSSSPGGSSGSSGSSAGNSGRGSVAASGGALHVRHMACSKGEARLESGGGPLTVDGLEGNAVLLSGGGSVKVHVHEQAGFVYVDSSGGGVEAWITPSGPPLGLQVNALGGVQLDPALQVTGEISSTSLLGLTGGAASTRLNRHMMATDSGVGASSASAMVQRAVADARQSAQAAGSAALGVPSILGSSVDASRLTKVAAELAASKQPGTLGVQSGAAGGCSTCKDTSAGATTRRQLIINAGSGSVKLVAMGWMDGVRAKMEAKQH